MMKKAVFTKIITLLLVTSLSLFVVSCKGKKADPNKPAETTNAGNGNLIPLEIELPKPMFVGTPTNIKVPNLEPPRLAGQQRPPLMVPSGTENVALGKPVTSSDENPIWGSLDLITDDDKSATDDSYVELGPFQQHITIDLQDEYQIYGLCLWHYHKQARVYFDIVVQVADDADFLTSVQTLFNNDHDNSLGLGIGQDKNYIETNEGKLINAKGVKARYLRCYSQKNNTNDLNHYIEVAVYGKPAK